MGLLQIDPPDNHIDSLSRQLLDWLDSEDATGEAFRYATVGHGNDAQAARPDQVQVNFYEQVNELHKLANLLHGVTRASWTTMSDPRSTATTTWTARGLDPTPGPLHDRGRRGDRAA